MALFGRTIVMAGRVRLRSASSRVGPLCLIAAYTYLAPLGAVSQAAPVPPRVIELFTSQSCPKCPPADGLIGTLARQPDTIALSFSVDTWDYSGWKDTLASPAFTARQNAYAASRGDLRVFTPQAIINGATAVPGADSEAIEHGLAETATPPVPLTLDETGGVLHVHVGAAPGGTIRGPVGVYVVRAARNRTVAIGRGRNSGRSITYTNVVRAMQELGTWRGTALDFQLVELKSDDEGYVVLVQTGTLDRPGPILAAAKTAGL